MQIHTLARIDPFPKKIEIENIYIKCMPLKICFEIKYTDSERDRARERFEIYIPLEERESNTNRKFFKHTFC